MYRIFCQFRPHYKRANGGTSAGPQQARRGAWVVVRVIDIVDTTYSPVEISRDRELGVLSFMSRRVGVRVSPIERLNTYLQLSRRIKARKNLALRYGVDNA